MYRPASLVGHGTVVVPLAAPRLVLGSGLPESDNRNDPAQLLHI